MASSASRVLRLDSSSADAALEAARLSVGRADAPFFAVDNVLMTAAGLEWSFGLVPLDRLAVLDINFAPGPQDSIDWLARKNYIGPAGEAPFQFLSVASFDSAVIERLVPIFEEFNLGAENLIATFLPSESARDDVSPAEWGRRVHVLGLTHAKVLTKDAAAVRTNAPGVSVWVDDSWEQLSAANPLQGPDFVILGVDSPLWLRDDE